MTGFEDFLSIVVQDIFRTVSLEVHMNPKTHPSLKDCPVGPVIASFDGVKVYLSWDVPVGRVRFRFEGQPAREVVIAGPKLICRWQDLWPKG